MFEQSVTYKPRNGYPFHITAKRYCTQRPPKLGAGDADSLTLIVLHGTGFHKETWEPTLERVFDLAYDGSTGNIREAWAIDCPNHGASAVLNESILRQPAFRHSCMYFWRRSLKACCLLCIFDSHLRKIRNCGTSLPFSWAGRRSESGFQKEKLGWNRSFVGRRIHVCFSFHVQMYFECTHVISGLYFKILNQPLDSCR